MLVLKLYKVIHNNLTPNYHKLSPISIMTMKTYRVRVYTNDGCTTIWYEKSSAKKAPTIICNRVCLQLQGLNLKDVTVEVSV